MLNFLFLLWRNGPVSFSKVPKLLLFLIMNLLLLPLKAVEYILFEQKIRRHSINKAPVFIIGHWRSGTTLLQRLLASDENKTYLNFYRACFPSFFLSTEKIVKPLLQKAATLFRLRIPYFNNVLFNWDYPCDDDTALLNMNSLSSAYWAYVFPGKAEEWFASTMFFTSKEDRNEKRWEKDYMHLLKKLSYAADGKQLILKSPPNTARIKQIVELFPDAKFIYLYRDPLEVFYSHRQLWRQNNRSYALQAISEKKLEQCILNTFKKMSYTFEEAKSLFPAENLVEVSYVQLVDSPLKQVRTIYRKLSLFYDRATEENIKISLRQMKNYTTFHYDYDQATSGVYA